jgi:tRNA uridine 5-carboxymethylaminomethyl modification enzyme
LNGFSSSLSWKIQYEAIRNIEGLENAKIFRPGYAIEYDYFPPTQLYATLETKYIKNLFFAGQINGTTGYEEAAAQGLMAGINASLNVQDREGFILKREEAYIGVLVDDLINKGVDEPYRMFTSRAEYRILLRQDNADLRLTGYGYNLGLASETRLKTLNSKLEDCNILLDFTNNFKVSPELINTKLEQLGTSKIERNVKLHDLIMRPQVAINDIIDCIDELKSLVLSFGELSKEIVLSTEIKIKYSGYIEREKQIAEKLTRLEGVKISDEFNFKELKSLSTEARQKLSRIKPKSIGQASRISGISPSDINILLLSLGR